MILCALRIQPLITSLQVVATAKQCWFANDVGGTGSTTEIKRERDMSSTLILRVQILTTSQTTRGHGLSQRQTRKKVSKNYLRKRTLV